MIIGVGTDVIEVGRIKKACMKQAFFERCFTSSERALIGDNYVQAAGNWAVKESVGKVFGTGISGFDMTDIEVLRDERGKPYINLYNQADVRAKELKIQYMHVSISNIDNLVIAYVIGESEE